MTRTPLSNPEARPADSGIHARRWVNEFANSDLAEWNGFRAVRLASGWPLICVGNREAFMASREPRTGDRVTDQSVVEVLPEHQQRRIRQGMRLHQEAWRKKHGPKRTVPLTSGAILLASGIFLGWASSRFWER